MFAIALAARIKLPKEVALPLAILGGVLIAVLLLVVLFRKLGKRGTLGLLGGVVMYAILTLGLGLRRAENQTAAAEREQERIKKIEAHLKSFPETRIPLGEACGRAMPPPKMGLGEVALVYRAHGQLTAARYQPSYGDSSRIYANDSSLWTYHEDALSAWARMAAHPFSWGQLLHDTEQFKLLRVKYALVADMDRAALVDLENNGRVLCAGKLSEYLHAEHSGYNDVQPALAKPLLQLCKHLDGDHCPALEQTATKSRY